jgi:hypothetical protein
MLEDWTFSLTATEQVQSACYFTYRASHQHKWVVISLTKLALLDGFLSQDSTTELQMSWDPGLQNLHRLEGESIFKEGRMLGTSAHYV